MILVGVTILGNAAKKALLGVVILSILFLLKC